jgi:hypothetical protein
MIAIDSAAATVDLRTFDEVPDGIALLDQVIAASLTSLHPDLPRWYEREQEIVSLYAFGHMVPLLLRERIDIGQLVVEGRIPQIALKIGTFPNLKRPYFDDRVRRDLVIRKRRHDGYFRVPGEPDPPFAVMEWKISVADRTPKYIRDDYETDLCWLSDNAALMKVGYCVLVEWPDGALRIRCARICGREVNREFLVLPQVAVAKSPPL